MDWNWQSIKKLFEDDSPEAIRQRRRDELGNKCSDMFCLDDPCRDCPNVEDHKKKHHWRYSFIDKTYGEGKWPK